MISRQNELLERSRKSIHYYVHEDQEELSRPGFYSHMLVEDVSSGIMPFRGTKIWETFKVVISPNSSDIENLVILALGEQYHRRALEEVVCDFCRECSQLLMSYGEAIYEISYLIDDEYKKIGWNVRQLFEDDMLEYYILHRRLLFEKFKIELRQSILATLNIGLGRA